MSGKKPQRLGMGLSALLGDAGTGTASPQALPVAAIEPGPFQPRGAMDQQALADLAASIREHGILQPILVRPKPGTKGSYQIIGGERRWRAAQMVPLHEIPVVIRDLDDRAALAAALVENLQREDLNPLEEAEGYQRLTRDFGLTQESLGKAVGKSRSHVANSLRLLALPARIKDLVGSGSLSAGHARALLTAPDPVRLAERVVTSGLNVRQTEALAAAGTTPRSPRIQDPETRAVERDLTAKLGLKVAIAHGRRGGTLTIAYRDLDQLDGLIRLLTPGA
jgi:ParB family chromosome partitioning protein